MKQIYNLKKSIFTLTCLLFSFTVFAQVDMLAAVDVIPPVSNGQTFNYSLETVSSGTIYNAVKVKLTYDQTVVQVNSLTPSGVFNLVIVNNISVPGVISFEAAKTGGNLNDMQSVFSVEFEVLDSGQNIIIINDTNPTDGAFVSNPGGNDVLGTTNDIDFSTLSTNNSDFKNNISIYPNPVKDELFIKAKGELSSSIKSIKIHAIDGKLVKNVNNIESRNGEFSINISNLKSALYFMTVVSEDGIQATYKILVK